MRKAILVAAIAVATAAAAQTFDPIGTPRVNDVSNSTQAPLYCQITVTTTATALSALLATAAAAQPSDTECATLASAIPRWASLAVITPETSATIALRWRAGGMAPTPTVGDPIFGYAKDPAALGYQAIANASLISATGASISVSVRIGG